MSPERVQELCVDTDTWIEKHPSDRLPRRLRGAWKIWKMEEEKKENKKSRWLMQK